MFLIFRATYGANYDCDIQIDVGHPFHSVNISFDRFSMQQKENDSCIDYIQFFTDYDYKEQLTDPLCGELSDLPEEFKEFTVNQETFVLKMITDGQNQFSGFVFTYVAYQDYHGINPDDIFISKEDEDEDDSNRSIRLGVHTCSILSWTIAMSTLMFIMWNQIYKIGLNGNI